MNLNKHLEFIEPTAYAKPIHIIGVGAVGSRVAEILTRLGFNNLVVYDFDIVEDTNITNQLYTYKDLGQVKTDALENHLKDINPNINLKKEGLYEKQKLEGTVFLCVDSIETRKRIVKQNIKSLDIDLMIDMRMRLTDAQMYAADWKDNKHVNIFLNSMTFKDADDLTPLSVCGTTLNVAPTVLTLISYGIMNFIRYIKGEQIKQAVFLDTMEFSTISLNY